MVHFVRALFIVLCFIPSALLAQRPEWVVFDTTNSPLPHNQIQAIASDSAYVWIGTANGLARYDGAHWTTYDTSNSPLPSANITALSPTGKGTVWIGTDHGAAFYDGAAWLVYDPSNTPMPSHFFTSMAMDTGGGLWAGTEHGLARWDGMHWTVFSDTTTPFVEPLVLSLASDSHGSIWFGTWDPFGFRGRLWRHDGRTWTNTRLDLQALPSSYPEAITVMDDGTVWLGTSGTTGGNLVNVTGSEWTTYNRFNSGLPPGGISSLVADGSVLWIGTGVGLVRYDRNTWKTYDTRNSGLPEDFILSVAVDANGNTWAGTLRRGVAVFRQGGIISSMPDLEAGTPEVVVLLQNYPNPFNGSTTIRFKLSSTMFVSLRVYDLLGREVSTLVHGMLEGGEHVRRWDAGTASSGTYYCMLGTPTTTRTSIITVLR
jgi:ligand-binding sensor domain-containing protein